MSQALFISERSHSIRALAASQPTVAAFPGASSKCHTTDCDFLANCSSPNPKRQTPRVATMLSLCVPVFRKSILRSRCGSLHVMDVWQLPICQPLRQTGIEYARISSRAFTVHADCLLCNVAWTCKGQQVACQMRRYFGRGQTLEVRDASEHVFRVYSLRPLIPASCSPLAAIGAAPPASSRASTSCRLCARKAVGKRTQHTAAAANSAVHYNTCSVSLRDRTRAY